MPTNPILPAMPHQGPQQEAKGQVEQPSEEGLLTGVCEACLGSRGLDDTCMDKVHVSPQSRGETACLDVWQLQFYT